MQVIDAVREVTGRPVPVRLEPRRPGDAAAIVATNDKARRELGWKPNRPDLRDIIADAWAFHRVLFYLTGWPSIRTRSAGRRPMPNSRSWPRGADRTQRSAEVATSWFDNFVSRTIIDSAGSVMLLDTEAADAVPVIILYAFAP
jgi:hypothetical protein